MCDGWIETTIGEQVTLQRGIDITKASQKPGDVPVVSSGGIASFHDTAYTTGPGVVLGRKGVVGSVYYIEPDYWPHDTSLWVRDFHGNHPRFVYYFFKHLAPILASMDVGSANPTLNRNHVHPIRVQWPPVAEQEHIAHILGTLDDKIELNRQMNRTLDEIARTLFTSWFVDFDPVRAKAEARQPEGMDAETAALFPDRFVDSELGPIPEGWEVRTINDVADINKSSLRASDSWESIRYIDISSTSEGNVAETAVYKRGEEPSRAKRRLAHGDTALSTVRPNRRSYFLALNPAEDLIASTGFAIVSPRAVPWAYLHSALTLDSIFSELGNLADGGAYPAVRPTVIGGLTVVVPSDRHLLRSYQRAAGPLYELAAHNRDQSSTLAELRDTLLPKMISGELTLPVTRQEGLS